MFWGKKDCFHIFTYQKNQVGKTYGLWKCVDTLAAGEPLSNEARAT